MSTFIVREASQTDAEQSLNLIRAVLAEPGIYATTLPEEFTLSIEDEQQYIKQHLDAPNSTVLIAVAASQIIGFLNSTGGERQANRHVTAFGISIHKDWRNKGVGSEMIAYLINWARSTEVIKRIALEVFAENKRAIHVYEKFGFVVEGRLHQAIYRHGVYHDVLTMAILLDESIS